MAGDPTRWRPETRETADHSIPYVVACALQFGTVEPAHFEDDVLRDPVLLDLMQRIEVVQDPECDAAWPEAIETSAKLDRNRTGGNKEQNYI